MRCDFSTLSDVGEISLYEYDDDDKIKRYAPIRWKLKRREIFLSLKPKVPPQTVCGSGFQQKYAVNWYYPQGVLPI